uniref:ORC1/DEAH AAA+ ATPase domain-containing protein n=1 Tax=candidate division WOR-3 bacterium TaxID=2052148 RepID=A0A7C3NGT3_UNCW3
MKLGIKFLNFKDWFLKIRYKLSMWFNSNKEKFINRIGLIIFFLLILLLIFKIKLFYNYFLNLLNIILPLLLLIISIFILYLRDTFFNNVQYSDDEIKNTHLSNIDEPAYNIKKNCEELKSIIENVEINNATIAVVGKWGTGKSTLLKYFQKTFCKKSNGSKKDKEIEIVYLNLISFYSSEQIYYNLIKFIGLKFRYRYWENIFRNYDVTVNGFKFYIDDLINFENRLNHFKNHIKKNIKSKKFILILDELDRLIDSETILEIFKFINCFSRIPNFYLITTIDRNALMNIFEKEYLISGYLNKTFDYKIELVNPIEILRDFFQEKIKIEIIDEHLSNDDSQKELILALLNNILTSTSIFDFDDFRDVIMLTENVKQIIKGRKEIAENIFLLDIILIEWLKFKHPLIWEHLMTQRILFIHQLDINLINLKEKNEQISGKIVGQSSDKDEKTKVNNFIEKVELLLNKNIVEIKSVMELILFLINFKIKHKNNEEEQENVIINFIREIFKEKLDFKDIFENTIKGMKINDEKVVQFILFKRLFRIHNLNLYLGLKENLLEINGKKFKSINEILEFFNKDFDNFKNEIKEHYLNNLRLVKEGSRLSIRDLLLEEILINIISNYDKAKVKDIFQNILDEVNDKMKENFDENLKEDIKNSLNKLKEIVNNSNIGNGISNSNIGDGA